MKRVGRARAAGILAVLVLGAAPDRAAAQTGVRGAPNAPPPGGAALEAHNVQLGDRVRAWRPAETRPLEGPVVGVSYLGMTVIVRDHAELVPFSALARLEVHRTRTHPVRGAVIGLAAGLLVGALVVNDDTLNRHLDGWERGAGIAATGVAGAGLGAIVGTVVRTGGWRDVDIGPRAAAGARVSLGPRIAFRVRF
jgi:hypothetical protein